MFTKPLTTRLAFSICRLVALFLALPAKANLIGNDTSNFNPTPDGLDYVTVHSSETLLPGILNSGLFANFAKNSLPPTIDVNGTVLPGESSTLFGDVSFAYGVAESFDIGLSFSQLLNQEVSSSVSGARFSSTGLNELRLTGKYRISRREPLGSAVVATVNVNQAANNPFAGEDAGPTFNLEGVLDYRLHDVLMAVNLGYRMRNSGRAIAGAVYEPLPNQIIASLGASYYLPVADLKLIGEVVSAKPVSSVRYVESDRISSELLLGLKYDASTNTAVNFGAGTRLGEGLFTPDWRIYAGLNFALDVFAKDLPPVGADQGDTVVVYKGYQPPEIEALRAVAFDEIFKRHEFH